MEDHFDLNIDKRNIFHIFRFVNVNVEPAFSVNVYATWIPRSVSGEEYKFGL